ncbi:Mitochondrial intermediate peptidase [Umbelopsis sp. WA50703]
MLKLARFSKQQLGSSYRHANLRPPLARQLSQSSVQLPIVASHVNGTDSKYNDEHLRMIFDSNAIWHQERNIKSQNGLFGKLRKGTTGSKQLGLFNNPNFVTAAGFDQAANETIERAQLIVERIWRAPENGENEMRMVVKNLDRLSDTLCCVIDMAEFIRNAHPDAAIMEAANKAYGDLCSYMNTLNTDTRLHKVLSMVMNDQNLISKFTPDEIMTAKVFMRDFEKSGIHLPSSQRSQFVDLCDNIIQLGRAFVQNNPRSAKHIKIEQSRLAGISPTLIKSLVRRDGYAYIPTDGMECHAVLKYVKDEDVRREVYIAMNSSTEESVMILEALMRMRGALGNLVGKESYGHLQLQDKMAKTPENVDAFLNTLVKHQKPAVDADLQQLKQAKSGTHIPSQGTQIMAWDRDYYMNVISSSYQAVHPSLPISPYFSVGSVMQGLSRLFKNMYGVHLEPEPINPGETWHSQVRKLQVVCEKEGIIGTMYCDLFARPGKGTNAAHYTLRTSRRVDNDDSMRDLEYANPEQRVRLQASMNKTTGSEINGQTGQYQLPVIVLTCDFPEPKSNTMPTLLSFYEVETLFHEMGHAMHSMLGRTDFHNVAGTRCATDFVELPSILMEHFVSDPQVLSLFANDYRNRQPLPYELVKTYLENRKRFSGIDTNYQIVMAQLDQRYHSQIALEKGFSAQKTWHQLQQENGLFGGVENTMWPTQFTHLFGYGSGYYSYLFDRTLARRIWQSCFEKHPLDREGGMRFREQVLRWGGARDPWECVASILDERDAATIVKGDQDAMRQVGDWGIDV